MLDAAQQEPASRSRSRAELDRLVRRLAGNRKNWVRVGIAERIGYLRCCIRGLVEVADEWVAEACRQRGIDPASALAGEEWLSGPMTTVRNLRLLVDALEQGGEPTPPRPPQKRGEQTIVTVFPRHLSDRMLYNNMSAEVWIQPGRAPTQGEVYREKRAGRVGGGGLALVLGAGNVSSIGPLDVAYKLFVEDQVVLLKMHPVNAYLGPFFERAFASLIEAGFLALAYGDRDVGSQLVGHPDVDSIHLTGSAETYDSIVWSGDVEERARRKQAGLPALDKPVTAELGCVTPVLVVPGRWSRSDLDFQARHVASMVTHNASFNCNAAKVIVLDRDWPQRRAFLDRVRKALAATPARRAYYPGARERYDSFLRHYPRSEVLGAAPADAIPWTLIPDVPARSGEHALENEAFCGVLAEVSLTGGDVASFVRNAVDLANESIWGTLSCVLLVDRRTERTHPEVIRDAVARLNYGAVGVNVWSGICFALGVTTWGAFPGHTAEAIGSGRGVVHNAYLFDQPEKSVVRAPFRIWPKPVWFADHRCLDRVGRALTRFEAQRSMFALARVIGAALRG